MLFRRWRLILLVFVAAVFLLQIVWNVKLPFIGRINADVVVTKLYRPIGSSFSELTTVITERLRNYFALTGVVEENVKLKSQTDELKIENAILRVRLAALAAYKDALEVYSLKTSELLPVNILSHDLFSSSKTILIDKGTKHGVAIDDVVVTGEGLVGRIFEAYETTSKILLLIDSRFAVDARNVRSGLRLLVSGASGESLFAGRDPFLTQVEYLENAREMHEGDPVATSGLGNIFPGGILIGRVERVSYANRNLFDKARVLPAVDFTKLVRAYVMVKKVESQTK